ncbi:hypothetical protein [Nostoc sp.]|uniref:hypothetical protein n=1 Tax=Nostoc sp. TaxID=1180 RepID=UPI0035936DB3
MFNVNFLTNLSLATVGAAVIGLGVAGTAQAATFTEMGDAGSTLSTAQNLPGGINVNNPQLRHKHKFLFKPFNLTNHCCVNVADTAFLILKL